MPKVKKEEERIKEKKPSHEHIWSQLFKTLTANFFSALVLKVCCSAVSTEVLLDMKATGGELGWLTWPLDQGDRPGVSPPPSLFHPPTAPTFPLGICL